MPKLAYHKSTRRITWPQCEFTYIGEAGKALGMKIKYRQEIICSDGGHGTTLKPRQHVKGTFLEFLF